MADEQTVPAACFSVPSIWAGKNSSFHQSKLTQLMKNAASPTTPPHPTNMTNSWVHVDKIGKNTDDTQRSKGRLLRSLLSHSVILEGLCWWTVDDLRGWREVSLQEQTVGLQGSVASTRVLQELRAAREVFFSTLGSSTKQGRASYASS